MQNTSSSFKGSSRKSAQTGFLILFIVGLLTMATHLYLTHQHYQLKLGSASGPAICNISATFNCDSVAASRFASLGGLPMALLGLMTQIVFFIFLIAARFELSQYSSWLRRVLMWLSLFIFVVSIIMGSISAFFLGTYCLFCMAAYALSLIQLFGAWQIQDESPFAKLPEDITTLFTQARWVLVMLILIPVGGWVVNSMTLSAGGFDKINLIIQDSLAEWEAGPAYEFQADRGLAQGAAAMAPVMTIVEFADFLCPHCKMASTPLESFSQAHPDVRMNFKLFTLDGTCNKAIPNKGDGVRCKLGAAVMCAEQIAKSGWKAHHWVFEKQEEFHGSFDAKSFTEKLSAELNINAGELETCMNADATHEALEAMAAEGAAAKIQGTPTIFVNGKVLPRGQFLPVLEAVYKKVRK